MKIILLFLLSCSSYAQITYKQNDIPYNVHSNFNAITKYCNIDDEANYCQQIVIDRRLTLVAVSFKCLCPTGWWCPSNDDETISNTKCQYDENKFWHKCQIRCIPLDDEIEEAN